MKCRVDQKRSGQSALAALIPRRHRRGQPVEWHISDDGQPGEFGDLLLPVPGITHHGQGCPVAADGQNLRSAIPKVEYRGGVVAEENYHRVGRRQPTGGGKFALGQAPDVGQDIPWAARWVRRAHPQFDSRANTVRSIKTSGTDEDIEPPGQLL
jgi:hypothetical protein